MATARTLATKCSIIASSDATLSEVTMKASATIKTPEDETSSLQATNAAATK